MAESLSFQGASLIPQLYCLVDPLDLDNVSHEVVVGFSVCSLSAGFQLYIFIHQVLLEKLFAVMYFTILIVHCWSVCVKLKHFDICCNITIPTGVTICLCYQLLGVTHCYLV